MPFLAEALPFILPGLGGTKQTVSQSTSVATSLNVQNIVGGGAPTFSVPGNTGAAAYVPPATADGSSWLANAPWTPSTGVPANPQSFLGETIGDTGIPIWAAVAAGVAALALVIVALR